MPFVEGESLRDRLRRERQLPVDAAIRIATEAARALEYAHRHGVIHRDIKTYWLRKDMAKARAYADSAQLAFAEQLRVNPEDGQRHVIRGLALAYLGRKAEAVAEGKRGASLVPISRDAYSGAYNQHQLARIYLLIGEPDKALDRLEPLLKIPYHLSPGWLKIDPTFALLKGNPRFERLIAGG